MREEFAVGDRVLVYRGAKLVGDIKITAIDRKRRAIEFDKDVTLEKGDFLHKVEAA